MTLVQTVYILKKDKYEQSSNQSRKTKDEFFKGKHPKGKPAPITTKKEAKTWLKKSYKYSG